MVKLVGLISLQLFKKMYYECGNWKSTQLVSQNDGKCSVISINQLADSTTQHPHPAHLLGQEISFLARSFDLVHPGVVPTLVHAQQK